MFGILIQTTQPANLPMQTLNLTTISGITIATMFLVEVVKRALCKVKALVNVPVFVYAGLISVILALLANKVIVIDGSPLLSGNVWKVVWAAIISALGSSGFYTWLRNPQTVLQASFLNSPKDDNPPPPMTGSFTGSSLLLLPLILIGLTGCQQRSEAEHIALREGMDQSSRTIRAEHKQWSQLLMVDASGKNHADQLPRLTPFDVNNRMQTHAEYENLVNEDRKRDSVGTGVLGGLFGGSKPPPPVPLPVPGPITAPPLAPAAAPSPKPKPAAVKPKPKPTTRPKPTTNPA